MRNDFRQLKFKLFLQIAATAAATTLMGLLIKKFFLDGLLRSPFSENFVRFCEKVFHMTHPAALQLYQDLFQKNRDILFMVVYIGLLLLMITLTISRVTRYFDEVSRAMDGLLTEDSTPIHLSSELAAVEDRINGVKVTLLQKRREALEAEQRKTTSSSIWPTTSKRPSPPSSAIWSCWRAVRSLVRRNGTAIPPWHWKRPTDWNSLSVSFLTLPAFICRNSRCPGTKSIFL